MEKIVVMIDPERVAAKPGRRASDHRTSLASGPHTVQFNVTRSDGNTVPYSPMAQAKIPRGILGLRIIRDRRCCHFSAPARMEISHLICGTLKVKAKISRAGNYFTHQKPRMHNEYYSSSTIL